jgi:hypothetical protein
MLYFAALMVAALYFVIFLGPPLWARATTEDSLREWAKGRGLEIISIDISSLGGRPPFQKHGLNKPLPWFPGRAQVKMRRHGEESEGRLVWDVSMYSMSNIEFTPSRVILPDQPAVSGLLAADASEADVLTEVNRRLDAITSQANWMEPYDLDGSGHVDEEEWAILRGSIMEEVRSELGDSGVQAVSKPDDGAASTLPAPEKQDDDEEENLW